MSIIYDPVPSWRLGRSLGIDPVSSPHKTCCFDCIYCQLRRTNHPLCERRAFVSPHAVRRNLAEIARSLQPDEVQLNTPYGPARCQL
jgi:wyosine [tRNA(Phe)-imidazoG37] synthetase (radical SAM superfamily)